MASYAAQAYLDEIGRYPLLTKTQEIILGTQVQAWIAIRDKDESLYTQAERRIAKNGQKAKDKFIKSNLRLVVNIASKYATRCTNLDFMDLVQEGNIGLARAIEKFDPTRGYAMSTYAYWWIRQAIQRSIQLSDLTIRLSIGIHETTFKIAKIKEEFARVNARQPTIDEISKNCDLSIEEIKLAINAPRVTTSLDRRVSDTDGETSFIELIADTSNLNCIDDAERKINAENIKVVINSYLDETTKYVITERMKDPPTSWKEMSSATGMTAKKLQLIEEAGIQRCALLLEIKNKFDV